MTARSGNNTKQLQVLRTLLTDLEKAKKLYINNSFFGCRQDSLPLFKEVERLKKECKEQKLLCGELPKDVKELYSDWVE